ARVNRHDVIDRMFDLDGIVLPIRQDMDRYKVDMGGEPRIPQPEFPYVGVTHGLFDSRPYAFDIAGELLGCKILAQQHLVADDDAVDDVGIAVGEADHAPDFALVDVGLAPEPGTLHHLHAQWAGISWNHLEPLKARIGSNRSGALRKHVDILQNLRECRRDVREWILPAPIGAEGDAVDLADAGIGHGLEPPFIGPVGQTDECHDDAG